MTYPPPLWPVSQATDSEISDYVRSVVADVTLSYKEIAASLDDQFVQKRQALKFADLLRPHTAAQKQ